MIERSMPKKLYLLPIASGLLMAAAFTFSQLAFWAWFALLPFLYVIFRRELRWQEGLWAGVLYSMSFYLALMGWLYEMLPLDWAGFGTVSGPVLMTVALVLVAILETVGFAFLGALMGVFSQEPAWKKLLLLIALWVLVEWLQSLGTVTGFTWGRVSISQYAYTPMIQSAALFGSLGLSGLMVGFQGMFLFIFLADTLSARRFCAACAFLLFFGNLCYGLWSLQRPDETSQTSPSFTAAIVQGNYSSSKKYADGAWQDVFNEYETISRQIIAEAEANKYPVDLIIWPETAIPLAVEEDITDKTRQSWISLAQELHTDFLIGASLSLKTNQQNVLIYTNQTGKSDIVYAKRHLMPFGEYLPARSLFSHLIDFSRAIPRDTLPGTKEGAFQLPQGKMAGLICFESIFPQLARKSVLAGAAIFILPTNDSWFRDSVALYQHNGQAVFRAVENGRMLLRAANAGVSSIIDQKGRIIQQLQPLTSGFLIEKVSLNQKITLYTKIGNLPGWLALAYIIFVLIQKVRNRNKPPHKILLPCRRFF